MVLSPQAVDCEVAAALGQSALVLAFAVDDMKNPEHMRRRRIGVAFAVARAVCDLEQSTPQ